MVRPGVTYLAWGIVDANVTIWSLAGAILSTSVAVVFADLNRAERFFHTDIEPDSTTAHRITVGFATTAGILYALTAVGAWRTGVNFRRFATLNRQRREATKVSLGVSWDTWHLMGMYTPPSETYHLGLPNI